VCGTLRAGHAPVPLRAFAVGIKRVLLCRESGRLYAISREDTRPTAAAGLVDTNMEGFLPMRTHVFYFYPAYPFAAFAAALAAMAGCARQPADEGRFEAPARTTASADPRQHTVRQIPDVIAKPKPFRMPDALRAVTSLEPATMSSSAVPPSGIFFPAAASDKAPQRLEASDPAATSSEALAQLDFPATPPAVEISGMMREYLEAFNRHDSAALASHWSTNGENIDLDSGETTSGREAVKHVFVTLFHEDAAAAIDIDIESIRLLRDDVAVVDGVSLISFSNDPATEPLKATETASGSRFSAVVIKHDGSWLLESVRETAVPVKPKAQRALDELQWLVGSWEDIGEGVTASTHCFWSAGKSFLIRSHVVTFDTAISSRPEAGNNGIPDLLPPGSGTHREITEIIGWDPQRRQIRSWIFTSDARFAEGVWSRDPDGTRWSVQLEGKGADNVSTCSCTLERVGPDEIAVRCDSDPLADVLPPACGFVRTARPSEAVSTSGQ